MSDDKLDAAWRAASREEPPAALDEALRAAARRAVDAGPSRASRARHMQTWPLAAAAVVAVLAIGIVQLTPPEQVTPTIVADSTSRQASVKEKDAQAVPAAMDQLSSLTQKQLALPSAPPPVPVVKQANKPQAVAPSGAGGTIVGAILPPRKRDDGAQKSKLETAAAADSDKKVRAEPFPAAPTELKAAPSRPAESTNATGVMTATSPPPAPPVVAAVAKSAPAPPSDNAVEARSARSDAQVAGAAASTAGAPRAAAAPAAAPPLLAKLAAAPERAKDAAPRTPDEWIKLIRRLQSEGRKEEAVKELAAFRAEYKERADALLPTDLREMK